MKKLVLKNLTAHKMRNKMTSIIFSLALGFIIFLIVSSYLSSRTSILLQLKKKGGYLVLSTSDPDTIIPSQLGPVIKNH